MKSAIALQLESAAMNAPVIPMRPAEAVPNSDWKPLGRLHDPPPFPVESLPSVVRQWVEATAEASQTPVDLAACAALGVLSACMAGTVVVDVAGRWTEEVNLYAICALESGDRKSAVLKAATAPLRAIEADRQREARPAVAAARQEREALERRIAHVTGQAAKKDDPEERRSMSAEAGQLAAQLDAEPEPVSPRLLADDATPEALAGLLARHGRIAVLAAESAFLDNLNGRYSDGRANLHLVCQAFTGEPTTVDRRGRDPERLERPLVTLALCVQPHVLKRFAADTAALAQGLVGRTLLVAPRSLMGRRQMTPAVRPIAVTEAWASLVADLAARSEPTSDTARNGGHNGTEPWSEEVVSPSVPQIRLSRDAIEMLDRLRSEQEPALREGGSLRPISAWVSRHPARIIRIAALLHLAGGATGHLIGGETMAAALAVGRWALAHAQTVMTGPDAEMTRALRWVERQEPTVTLRDLHRGLYRKGEAGPVDEARALAQRLVDMGALRERPTPDGSTQGGRPPSPEYDVNPELLGDGRGAGR